MSLKFNWCMKMRKKEKNMWMSTITVFCLKTHDFICLRHLASYAQSLQEHLAHLAANQSVHTILAT